MFTGAGQLFAVENLILKKLIAPGNR